MQKNRKFKLLSWVLTVMLVLGMSACSSGTKPPEFKPGSGEAPVLSDTDYSDMNNWLSFGGDKAKDIDIFMIYPTVTTNPEEADLPYVRLDSDIMREAAAGWLRENGAVVADSANIYAPFYRQLNGVALQSLDGDGFYSMTNGTPREDVFAAFDYYLTNINKGERPFIIFGNSQGAKLTTELATTFLGSEKYYQHNKNLIIAYAIGVSVTADHIALNPNLTFSQRKDDTRVLVSWNTTAPSEVASGAYTGFGTWKQGALMTNPISWTTEETPANADDNKASLVFTSEGAPQLLEGYADAVIDKEHCVLVVTSVDESLYPFVADKISKYHRYDIAFFYDSIRQNIKDRIAAFQASPS